ERGEPGCLQPYTRRRSAGRWSTDRAIGGRRQNPSREPDSWIGLRVFAGNRPASQHCTNGGCLTRFMRSKPRSDVLSEHRPCVHGGPVFADRARATPVVVPHRMRYSAWNDYSLSRTQHGFNSRYAASQRSLDYLHAFFLLDVYVIPRDG